MTAARDDGLRRDIDRVTDELAVVEELVELDHKRILDLGCGRALHTRAIAAAGAGRDVLALEVDEVQHRRNLELGDLPNLRFGIGGAEQIPAPDGCFDVVFLFKSLHHVPVVCMDEALEEVARVLVPAGVAYVSEPLFRGAYNDVLRIFHDEGEVRRAASAAMDRALARGVLELVAQEFFCAPLRFRGFEEFEELVIGATHSAHALSDEQRERTRAAFSRHQREGGAEFAQPIRVDLLRRPS